MRHNKAGRKFSRPCGPRKALLKGLLNSLFEHDKLKTTEAKAKTLRPLAERLITMAKKAVVNRPPAKENEKAVVSPAEQAKRRLAFARLGQKKVVTRLFETVAPRYQERKGGYARIIKLGRRLGDAAEMALIELV
ncbi:MAG: 50S ribosomal protein L17 [Candidatus Riflebacteria bacterium]|nr:50S ribosomal protein L17 [Candidatus Riflebacteria bacterium]